MADIAPDSLWVTPPLPDLAQASSLGDELLSSVQLVVCGCFASKEANVLPDLVLGSPLAAEFESLVTDVSFAGEPGSSASVRCANGIMVAVVGLGPEAAISGADFDKLGSIAAAMAKERKSISKMCLVLPSPVDPLYRIMALEGVILGGYKDKRWKARKEQVASCDLVTLVTATTEAVDLNHVRVVCESVIFTRQLVNTPANVLNAAALADCMREVADCYELDITVLEKEDCLSRNMGCYMAVAQGAESDPKFIHMTYRPQKGEVKARIAFVGKAITFDSGGYNLKVGPESMMNMMKFDMGGAATIFGAARALAQLRPEGVEVHFVAAACENLVSGAAYRPGDVIRASNGKTVEVVNTDAEGRMTLADALVYADGLGADYIIDLATLTGSMVVGLGNEYAGVFTPSDEIADLLLDCIKSCGEKAWRMPVGKEYREGLESDIADVKQLNKRAGDCVNAAVFLNEFVEKTKRWAHWDIAGTCWSERKGGATGYGVRSLVTFTEAVSRAAAS